MRLSAVRIVLLTAALALSLGLAGCGVRGSLENPDKADASATADSGQGKKEGAALKPHKPFILDGLIR
ncbi:MAG: lipoprotein [Hyphomicrobiaceae bacterium]